MPRFSRSSISRTLLWTNMAVSGAVLAIACLALISYDLMTFRDSVTRNLSIQAGIIGSSTISALVFDDPDAARNTLTPLGDAPNIALARVYTKDGSLFAQYRSPAATGDIALPAIPSGQTQTVVYRGDQ